jgi:uncharacterized protein GlcG (DUF336 family)
MAAQQPTAIPSLQGNCLQPKITCIDKEKTISLVPELSFLNMPTLTTLGATLRQSRSSTTNRPAPHAQSVCGTGVGAEKMAEIRLSEANSLIAEVFAEASRLGLPPLAVAVLDPGGHLRAMQRQDGLSFLRAEICRAKAWGALALGVDSRRLAERFSGDLLQQGFIQGVHGMAGGSIIPLPGGVLLRDSAGTVIGAIGVAGAASDQDEACALAAIRRVGLHTTEEHHG